MSATFLFFIFGALILTPLASFVPIKNFIFLLPCYGSSLLYTVYSYSFVTSLATGETSLVTPIYSLNGLILLIFSFLFLSEPFTITKIMGVILMIIGVSLLKDAKNPFYSARYIFTDIPSRMMFLAVTSQCLGRVIDKYYLPSVHPVTYSTILYFFIAFNLLVILLIRGKVNTILKVFNKKPKLSITSGLINGFSYLFLLYAMQQIDLSLAEPLTNLSLVLTLLFSFLFFKENVIEKLPGSILILLGGWFLYLNF
ncbi:MAG: EamA family transporter [Atribacterota bacterium]|nr:EamA family transporter [Atribacterota bacterium]MDD4289201.1 EamA family transporter [Atribacterota bacterium]MDD4764605.1 EamA family transporter [Atribacterota bacterium]MDI9596370.1 EamA family transporter [Atribacterota bacterium]